MGFLADRFAELRFDPGRWLTEDDDYNGPISTAGVRVNRNSALALSTVWRCIDLLSSAVSQAPKDAILKVGSRSFPEFGKPAWMSQPEPGNPAMTLNEHVAQVAVSLLLDGNFFTYVFPHVLDPQLVISLDPRRIVVRRNGVAAPEYDILDRFGDVSNTVGPMEMLHGTWLRPPGELRGLAPLEVLRQSFGGAIASQDFSNRFFGQGASLAFGVEVPGSLDKTQKDQLAESLRKKHAGLQNSHAIGVLTGGAKFVSGLAPTPEQSQMLATREFQREDLAAIYGVPPHYVNAQKAGASSRASAEVYGADLKAMAILPLAERIEPHYSRLLSVPDSVTAPNASMQFKFNLDHFARADTYARAQALEVYVRSGQLTPNEARGLEDNPPLPGGERLYMQAQMTPIEMLGMGMTAAGSPVRSTVED